MAHILIVTGDYSVPNIFSIYCKQYNILCNWTRTVDEAVAFIKKDRSVTTVITDIILEGATGIELCDIIHKDIRIGNIPVYFITAVNITSEISKRLRIYNDVYYYQRPVDPQLIVNKIKEWHEI